MIGVRGGRKGGRRGGLAGGLSGDVVSGASADFLLLMFGQSAQGYGNAFNEVAGSSSSFALKGKSASDPGLAWATPFPGCQYRQDSADATANPQVWTVQTGIEALQRYAATNATNVGQSSAIGRFLKNYGVFSAPAVTVCAIGSSSVPVHWLPASNFPASGEKLYAHLRDFGLAVMGAFGRPIDLLWWGIGDTDAGVPARVTSMQSDATTMLASLRSDWGLPALPVFMGMIHPDLQSPADATGYRAQQVAFQPTDIDCTLVDSNPVGTTGPIGLDNNPHFTMGGCNDYGNAIAMRIKERFKPGANLNLGSGPAPYYQGGGAGFSAGTGTGGLGLTARPRGWVDPQPGDIEILDAHGSNVAHTVTLPTAASFTSLIAQTESVLSTSHRSLTVWKRTIDSTLLNARTAQPDGVKRYHCANPEVDFGLAPLNWATIHCVRGSSGIDTTSTGANNANSASLSIGGFTTSVNNCLVMFLIHGNVSSATISSLVNAGLTNIQAVRQSVNVNPGSGTINTFMWTAIAPTAGAYGATAVTFGSTTLAVGAAIVFKP